ncbi:MAG: DUF5698 domain-containing protein [Ignavibacteriaceae bacterium]|jgi:uncharacterized protein YebE (UPF0316 family)
MWDIIGGAAFIASMRVCDVTLDTIRVINVVQGKKYLAGIIGFFEVLIWVFAIRLVFKHLDVIPNLFGYAIGFGLGNVLGITIEQKIGLGFVQLNIISLHFTDAIADSLRKLNYALTILPGEGGTGGVSVIVLIIERKEQKKVIKLLKSIDLHAFITVQNSIPHRDLRYLSRK